MNLDGDWKAGDWIVWIFASLLVGMTVMKALIWFRGV
jgi:hypothetical protein